MKAPEVDGFLDITPNQRRTLVRRGHLQRRRVDAQGNPCPHDETLEPCSCSWDYDTECVHMIGRVGTANHVPPGARARPLPPRFRFDPGTPAEEIAEDLALREAHRRRRSVPLPDAYEEPWTEGDEQPASWGWLLALGAVLVVGLGLAWHGARLSARGGAVGPP